MRKVTFSICFGFLLSQSILAEAANPGIIVDDSDPLRPAIAEGAKPLNPSSEHDRSTERRLLSILVEEDDSSNARAVEDSGVQLSVLSCVGRLPLTRWGGRWLIPVEPQ